MKKYINIISIISAFVFGIASKHIYDLIYHNFKEEYIIENIKLTKKNDSLEILIQQKDTAVYLKELTIISMEKRQKKIDSLLLISKKIFTNEKNKIKYFTNDSRIQYVDSVLKRAGIRK